MDAIRNALSLRLVSTLAALTASTPAWAQTITAVVRLKEQVAIETLAHNVQDPSSPRYGIYYTPEEIRELSAPSKSDYDNALAQLRKEGFDDHKRIPDSPLGFDPRRFEAFRKRLQRARSSSLAANCARRWQSLAPRSA